MVLTSVLVAGVLPECDVSERSQTYGVYHESQAFCQKDVP